MKSNSLTDFENLNGIMIKKGLIMTTETIKKEAKQYLKDLFDDVPSSYGLPSYADDIIDAFVTGAQWRMDSVWHHAKLEKPSLWKLILMKDTMGEYDLGYELKENAVSWAYVVDLIPNDD